MKGEDGREGLLESGGGKAGQQEDQEHHVNDRFPDVRSLAREVEARQGRLRRRDCQASVNSQGMHSEAAGFWLPCVTCTSACTAPGSAG